MQPKAHAWWHLLDDLERLRGLKYHQESKIEVSHQVGRRIDLLFHAVNDVEKKIECSLKYQHTSAKPSMLKIQSDVKEKRSRKRKAADDNGDADVQNRHRELLLLAEIVEHFPSLQQLSVAARKEDVAVSLKK